MTFSQGGTITLQGKTYNISQINSVYTGSIKRYNNVWLLWFLGGFLGIILMPVIPLWIIATIASIIAAIVFSSKENYAVFFDMSSGKVSAYCSEDREKVEQIRKDIIKGLENGYFPNYLQGNKAIE